MKDASSSAESQLDGVLKLAKGLGIDSCEAYCSYSKSTSIATVGTLLKSKEKDVREGFAVRVLVGGRLGFSFFDEMKNAKKELSNAKKLATFSPKNEFSFAKKQRYGKVDAFDRKLAEFDEEGGKRLALDLISGVKRHAKPTECGVDFGESGCSVMNSEGLYASEKRTGMSAFCQANYNGNSSYEAYSGIKLLEDAQGLGARAGKIAKEMDGAKKVWSGKKLIVLETEAVASLLESVLMPSINGDWARRNISKFCGKEGEEIASGSLSLLDDPFSEGAGRSGFDGEGVASRKLSLIEKGRFRNFLFDRKTAALARIEKEGNCGRGDFASQPHISDSNLVVAPGKVKKFEDEYDSFLLVRAFHGEHTANAISGDFSVALDVGWEVIKGKKTPARGNLIAGNIFELIRQVEAIEKDAKVYSDFISPRLAFEGVQVVG